MEDLFKKFVYTCVGLVASTVEKMQKSVEKLVDEDKISQEEGKKIIDDLVKNTEAKREEFEGKLKTVVEEVLTKMNLATQSQVKDLTDRLAAVEAKVGVTADEAATASAEDDASKKKALTKTL